MNAKTTIKERLTTSLGKKQLAAIAILLAIGGVAAVAILSSSTNKPAAPAAAAESEHKHEAGEQSHSEAEPAKGPNGGQLMIDGDFGLEVVLAEQGGEARMKLWLSQKGQPLPPSGGRATAELVRPGGVTDKISFTVDKDVLISTQPVAEPHVFEGTITLQTATEPYIFTFSQKEGVIALSDAQVQSAASALTQRPPHQ